MKATTSSAVSAAVLALGAARRAAAQLPVDKVYGVNLGSWFVVEPYMMNDEWVSMGGDSSETCGCGDGGCAGSEWDLTNRIGQDQANDVFATHWSTWITQDDVSQMAAAGINTVRIPLGFWIVEAAKGDNDKYATGGFSYLTQGLGWLADAGIYALLDLHALPDAQVANNAFAGRCNPTAEFWNNANDNFARAAQAAANLTTSAHTINEWRTVFAIEAVNEPPSSPDDTPGYGDYMDQFTAAVRNAESSLTDITPLSLTFMDYHWQYGGSTTQVNPADHTSGSTFYDNHLYYSFGGVASAATQDAYLTSICSEGANRVAADADVNNSPLVFGEWWLDVESGVGTDDAFIKNWSDAQRLAYENGGGWMFWSWKMGYTDTRRAYVDGLAAGYFPQDASQKFNADVCSGYTK